MADMTKTVRAIDADAYRAFRAKAVELGYSTGEAVTEAMRIWVNAKSKPRLTVRALTEEGTAPPTAPTQATVAAEPT